jgi:hypothetical protein
MLQGREQLSSPLMSCTLHGTPRMPDAPQHPLAAAAAVRKWMEEPNRALWEGRGGAPGQKGGPWCYKQRIASTNV